MILNINITKNITTLAVLGLTITPVLSNTNNALKNNLNSNFILTKIAHANEPMTDIDSLTETAHTPVYHLETSQGWSNDLQTINWNEKGGYYDIYFLHSVDGATNAFGPHGQNWSHCTTKDFVHFSNQNDAISSNVDNSMSSNEQSWKSAWTGSVVQNQGNIAGVPKGDYVAYFSGLKKSDGSQNIWAAWSDDNGRTFSHVLNNGNPVLPYNASFASNDKDNERDAYVCYWNGKILMYCAEGDKLGVYQSKDGVNWSKADPAGASKVLPSTFMKGVNWTDANKPIECPCLKMMTTPNGQTKAVLFYGDKTPQDGQTTGTYYVVGHLDQNGLFAADSDAKRLDLGSDYYGSNFSGTDDLNKPNSSIDTIGWVGNWSYTSNGVHNSQDGTGPYTGRLGSYTLPRKLTLNNDLTLSSNIDDSNLHLTNTHTFNNVTKDKPATKDGKLNILGQDADYGPMYTLADIPDVAANGEYDLHFTNPDGYKGRIYIHIWQGADYVKLNFDPTNNNFRVAGKATELNDDLSGTAASSAYYDGMLGNGNGYAEHLDNAPNSPKDFHLKIFTDKDSVEFQFPNGQTYTVARYAINDNQDFKVYSQDPTGKNTMTLAVNTVDTLPKSTTNTDNNKPATNTGTTANTATTKPNTNTATTKPSDSKPATNTGTTNTTENKPATGTTTPTTDNNKPAAGNTENKPTTTQPTTNNTNTTYKYSVAYFNNNTGQSMKTAEFTSPDKLSDSDLSSKINSNAPGKVIKYNVDETKKNDDGSTSVDIIALVDTSSSNTTTNKPATDNKPATNTGNTANTNTTKPTTNTATENTTKPATTNTEKPSDSKPATGNTEKPSDNKSSSSSSAAKDDKPATNTATTKPSDNKSSSSNTGKNDKPATNTEKPSDSKSSSSSAKDDKPVTGNSNKADTNTTKPATNTDNKSDSNKSSSSTDKADSGKASNTKPTDNSNKSDNKADSNTAKPSDSKPATGTETKPDGNKTDTNTVKSSVDKTLANSGKVDSNKANSTENKSDAKSDNKQSAGTTTDKNGVKSSSVKNINATGTKSVTSSLSESSKKSSMKSEINSGKSSSSSVSSKHNSETEISSVKSSSSNNRENESSLTSSVKSSSAVSESDKSDENSEDKTANNSFVVSESKKGTGIKSDVNSSSSSATENTNQPNESQANNVFQEQTAGGTNNNSEPNQGAISNPDKSTYSAQKVEMLAKTNAKAEQGGIIAAIGAVIATIAGWFGLKKKN